MNAQARIARSAQLDRGRNAPAIAAAYTASLDAAASTIAVVGLDRSPDPAALFASLRLIQGGSAAPTFPPVGKTTGVGIPPRVPAPVAHGSDPAGVTPPFAVAPAASNVLPLPGG